MRDRLAALLAVLFLATGLAFIAAPKAAYAAQQVGPPSAQGAWAFCRNGAVYLGTGGPSGNVNRWHFVTRCQVSTTYTIGARVGIPITGSNGLAYLGLSVFPNGTWSSNYGVVETSGHSATLPAPGNLLLDFVLDTPDASTAYLTTQQSVAGSNCSQPVSTEDPTMCFNVASLEIPSGTNRSMSSVWMGQTTTFGWSSAYFSGGTPPPPPAVPCTVTWDAPTAVSWDYPHTSSGPWMFAGRVVTFTIHLDDLSRYVAVDVGARRISDFLGIDTPAPPTPPTPDPNFVSARSTTLAHDMTLQVTLPFDGIYMYQYRCQTTTGGLTNEIGGTLTGLDPWPADVVISECIPVIGVETCGQRPAIQDCLPTSSGGLFGILGTVLDPNTYVKATICMAEALFMPGTVTTNALQHLWTLAQSRAPFSYIYDALAFLPSALTSFSSGLSGATGGCLINVPGAGCASIGTTSDLSLVRGVLLFLFVGLLTLAVIRTTMRVANGG